MGGAADEDAGRPRVAILGRPNVGKSTLFNRLVGKRLALVDDTPGVTRDLREGEARLGAHRFTLIDTAGMDDAAAGGSLGARMTALARRAIDTADLCLFVFDARTGPTPGDEAVAAVLRAVGGPVIVLANKAEGRAGMAGTAEGWRFGLGEPLAISAEHGEGMAELAGRMEPALVGAAPAPAPEPVPAPAPPAHPLQIAVMGRPNAGKSTLLNAILGEDRLLTGPEAGITRDSISIATQWGETPVRLFDTAGLRRKARVSEKLEKLAVADALRAIRFAEVVVVLTEATAPFETQDLRLADLAHEEGRAVVLAVSKWDLVTEKAGLRAALAGRAGELLPQIEGAALVPVSALEGTGLGALRRAVLAAHAVWNRRVPTAALNRWLAGAVAAHPPPAPGGRRVKLRYATQVRSRPPGFVIMCSNPEAVPDSYRRYLIRELRAAFDLPGVPIRLTLRSQAGKNPYAGRRRPQPSRLRKHVRAGARPPPGRRR